TVLARLGTVTNIVVGARRAVEDRHVLAARLRIAGVRRARVAIVAIQWGTRGADPPLAGLTAVAHRRVRARRAVRDGRVLTPARVADVVRARVRVVAVHARRARLAAGNRGVLATTHRVARIDRACVAVVAGQRCPWCARAGLARLIAVADVAVRARAAVCEAYVIASGDRVEDVGRAPVAHVTIDQCPDITYPDLAHL